MFALKKNTKEVEVEDPRDEQPLGKKGKKQGMLLVKGVRKFLRYNDDLMTDEQKRDIHEKRDEFVTSLDDPKLVRKDVEKIAEDLTEECKKSVKSYRPSAMKENIEVIFVAVVIAMGIRAYFIQQFKIPTGSMQPTLNGIIAHADPALNPKAEYKTKEGYEPPGALQRVWDKVWYGRSHVKWISEEDDFLLFDQSHFYDETHFIFFPRTYLVTQKGHTYSAPGTKSRVANLLNFKSADFASSGDGGDLRRMTLKGAMRVEKGQVIARGFIDTGDQLVVDKFTYHWRAPKRGEVFVFNTKDIRKIQMGLDPRQGSQHYIKRLAGLPGDSLEIRPPQLFVDGEPGKEPGFVRVAAQEGYYTGYVSNGGSTSVDLGEKSYWALGDNSANSSDSRNWGTVPEKNIVGRAAFVYYPFGHHFGKIR